MLKFVWIFLLGTLLNLESLAQMTVSDSLKNSISKDTLKKKTPYKIIPRTATIRSLILPSWGQYYNRQYWKMPVVYGGFAAIGLVIAFNDVRYQKYLNTYEVDFFNKDANGDYTRNANKEATVYEESVGKDITYSFEQIKVRKDFFRRNRDYAYIGLIVMWAFNIVDANVSAHLKTFDVSDDISMKIQPSFSNENQFTDPTLGAKLVFAFK
jgi:Family of unknown function (DUF5683)